MDQVSDLLRVVGGIFLGILILAGVMGLLEWLFDQIWPE